jgi:colanic acid/amylovoran biosynthesis glycosyltransferase
MTRARTRRGIHLVEIGLVWPPETFLQWKLERLAARGYRITVAGTASRRQARTRLAGVTLRRQPSPWDESRARLLAGILRDGLLLALTKPGRLRATIHAARNPLREPGWKSPWATLARLRSYLPLAGLRPDVVHFEWNSSAIHFLPMLPAWSCPAVVSCHGSDVNIRPFGGDGDRWGTYLAQSFDQAAGVHCVSEAIVENARAFGLDRDRAWLIRPAVDPESFAPGERSAPDPEVLRVLAIGDFRWLKGHEYALQAVRHLLDAGVPVHFEIVGGDPHGAVGEASNRERLVHTIEDLGLGGHVRLAGHVQSEEVRLRLAESDVLLHASLSEGIPTAVLEAMSSTLPVVVSDSGGVGEAVTDGVEGLVVPIRDSRAAAEALQALWRDPARARAMGEAGRRRVVSDFALERQIDRYAELYEHVVRGPSAPGRAERAARPASAPASRSPGEAGPPAAGALRILSVGPLEWERGYEYALHAVALLVERGVECEYRVVGEGGYLDAVSFARHQLGLDARVLFLSPGRERLAPLLSWADVFLDAAVTETVSSATTDAVAAGLPVVSTGGGDQGERGGRRDPDAIAEAIASVAGRRTAERI